MKKLLFTAITALVPIVTVELAARALEVGVRWWGGVENPFVSEKDPAPVFKRARVEGRDLYVRTHHHWIQGHQSFDAVKSKDHYRVFCIGSSASRGWPHRAQWSYPAMLTEKLRRLYPQKKIEVLNVGGNTYASYRSKLVFDEVIGDQPDLIIVYMGNNEFLENFVYNPETAVTLNGELREPWNHLALARLLFASFAREAPKPAIDVKDYGARDLLANRLSFAFGQASRRRRDPEQFRIVREQYRYNVEQMAEQARRRGVAFLLMTVPVNLKDWLPNASAHRDGLTGELLNAWKARFQAGFRAVEAEQWPTAESEMREALRIDGEYAEAYFYLGRALERQQKIPEAREAYWRALDADAYPFRCPFNRDLREIAERRGLVLVDTIAALERVCPNGLLGFDVLVDYVHPTVAANEIIAQEALVAMERAGLLPGPTAVALGDVRLAIPAGVEDELETLRGLYSQCLVMRQYAKLSEIADRLRVAMDRELSSPQPRIQAKRAELQDRLVAVERVVGPYQRLLLAEKRGNLHEVFKHDEAEKVFKDYVALVRDLEVREMREKRFARLVPSGPEDSDAPAARAADAAAR